MMRWMLAFIMLFTFYACSESNGADRLKMLKEKVVQEDKGKKKKEGSKDKEDKKDKKKGKKQEHASGNNAVEQLWELPASLTEISGIAWYDAEKLAGVQDETGTIFIYDLAGKKIEREIRFAGKGDYEDVAVKGNLFYVLRSDGTIIEVNEKGQAKEYDTPLDIKNDTEGLFYDPSGNRLLIALKAGDKNHPGKKTVYSFDLKTYKLDEQPLLTIDLSDPRFGKGGRQKENEAFQPSAIAIHPITGDIYFTDGANPALLVMSMNGELRSFTKLDRSVFHQPEGITFTPQGDLYISTEGVKQKGKIAKVSMDIITGKEPI